jgi:pimeloyl-ACP methyl ester carboxylesterase
VAALILYQFHRGIVRADVGSRAFRSANYPLIVFTHHFGGHERQLWRHVELVTKLGFDAVTFNFSWHGPEPRYSWPFGLHHIWAGEIESVLNQFPDRKKIIYSFSGPGASALECIARRVESREFDIAGLIADSGPFADPWYCTRKLIQQHLGYKKKWLVEAKLTWMMLRWGLKHERNLHDYMKKIRTYSRDLPILSIRGALDPLVPPKQIDAVFAGAHFSSLTVETFEKSGHLNAIKTEPKKYRDVVGKFLTGYISD